MKTLTFTLAWLAMTAVVSVLNALPHREESAPELPGAARNRPTPPSNFRR
jgi:hypothetical protein